MLLSPLKNLIKLGQNHGNIANNNLNWDKWLLSVSESLDEKSDFSWQTVAKLLRSVVKNYVTWDAAPLTLSNFTWVKAKGEGISTGGFYSDDQGQQWLIKAGHFPKPLSVITEYVSGGLYQLFLGANAPQIEIIVDAEHNQLLNGSKLLKNFKTLKELYEEAYHTIVKNHQPDNQAENQTHMDDFSNWNEFYEALKAMKAALPTQLEGKPMVGFMELIAAVIFMGDVDAHPGNVGGIDHGDYYSLAKIDHGFSLQFGFGQPYTLDSFREHLSLWYSIDDLNHVGFDAVNNALHKIADLDFSVIEQTVTDKLSHIKPYMDAVDLTNVDTPYDLKGMTNHPEYDLPDIGNGIFPKDCSLAQFQTELVAALSDQHKQFKKLAAFMDVEKSIIDHNIEALSNALHHQVKIDDVFQPFYDPVIYHTLYGPKTEGVTPLDLIQKKWPSLYEPLSNHVTSLKNGVLDIKDIFDIGQVQQVPAPAMGAPEVHWFAPEQHLPEMVQPIHI